MFFLYIPEVRRFFIVYLFIDFFHRQGEGGSCSARRRQEVSWRPSWKTSCVIRRILKFCQTKTKRDQFGSYEKKSNILTPKAPHTKHKKPSNKETCEIAVLVAFIWSFFKLSESLEAFASWPRITYTEHARRKTVTVRQPSAGLGDFFFFGRSKGNLKHTPLED